LELPPGGNGRSRDEWVDALRDLLPHQPHHHHHQQQEEEQEAGVVGKRGYKHSGDGSSSLGDMDFLSFSDNGDAAAAGRGPSGVVAPGAAASSSTPGRQHLPAAGLPPPPPAAAAAGGAGVAGDGRASPLLAVPLRAAGAATHLLDP
jgi:hypothetical protein